MDTGIEDARTNDTTMAEEMKSKEDEAKDATTDDIVKVEGIHSHSAMRVPESIANL